MAIYRNRNSITLLGVKEINDMFNDVPKQINKDALWSHFFNKISKPLRDKAKQKADAISAKSPNGTGQLGKSIGFFRTKASKKFKGGYVGPRVKGRFAKKTEGYKGSNKKKMYSLSGFYGAWIEYGKEVKFGGKGFGKKNQPYMKPAFDETKDLMLNNAFKNAEDVVAKAIKRHEKRMQKYGRLGY